MTEVRVSKAFTTNWREFQCSENTESVPESLEQQFGWTDVRPRGLEKEPCSASTSKGSDGRIPILAASEGLIGKD